MYAAVHDLFYKNKCRFSCFEEKTSRTFLFLVEQVRQTPFLGKRFIEKNYVRNIDPLPYF